MRRRQGQADALIGDLTAALRDATEQLREAVEIMRECPNCSQHVHRKDSSPTMGGDVCFNCGKPMAEHHLPLASCRAPKSEEDS